MLSLLNPKILSTTVPIATNDSTLRGVVTTLVLQTLLSVYLRAATSLQEGAHKSHRSVYDNNPLNPGRGSVHAQIHTRSSSNAINPYACTVYTYTCSHLPSVGCLYSCHQCAHGRKGRWPQYVHVRPAQRLGQKHSPCNVASITHSIMCRNSQYMLPSIPHTQPPPTLRRLPRVYVVVA